MEYLLNEMKNNPQNYNGIFYEIYKNYKKYNYSSSEYCKLHLQMVFDELYDINIDFNEIQKMEKEEKNKRVCQEEFREEIIKRFDKCIVSCIDSDSCDAAHILDLKYEPLSYDVNNGILLNKTLHYEFDTFKWGINPDTLTVVIADKYKNRNLGIKNYDGLDLTDKLSKFPLTKDNLIKKWELFVNIHIV